VALPARPTYQNQILAGARQVALPGGGVFALARSLQRLPFDFQDAVRVLAGLKPRLIDGERAILFHRSDAYLHLLPRLGGQEILVALPLPPIRGELLPLAKLTPLATPAGQVAGEKGGGTSDRT
jgi:hypothetical protein